MYARAHSKFRGAGLVVQGYRVIERLVSRVKGDHEGITGCLYLVTAVCVDQSPALRKVGAPHDVHALVFDGLAQLR